MVVDLAVDGQDVSSVGAHEGLLAGERVDDGQALVGNERVLALKDAGPIRTTMTDLPGHLQKLFSQMGGGALLDIKNAYESTHGLVSPSRSCFVVNGSALP